MKRQAAHIATLAILALASLLGAEACSTAKFIREECGGRPAYVPTDCSDGFQNALKDTDSSRSFKATIAKQSAEASTADKEKWKRLGVQYDALQQTINTHYIAACLGFCSDPCGGRDTYNARLEAIRLQADKLREIAIKPQRNMSPEEVESLSAQLETLSERFATDFALASAEPAAPPDAEPEESTPSESNPPDEKAAESNAD